jgi:DNA-directed RNA polymerase sigma subunit (sigma70/sigma32)
MPRPYKSDTIIDGSVDAGLVLLEATAPYGRAYTRAEIAFVCGCSPQNIRMIEVRAMKKLRKEFLRRLERGE